MCGGHYTFSAPRDVLALVRKLRREIDSLLDAKARNPGLGGFGCGFVDAMRALVADEEHRAYGGDDRGRDRGGGGGDRGGGWGRRGGRGGFGGGFGNERGRLGVFQRVRFGVWREEELLQVRGAEGRRPRGRGRGGLGAVRPRRGTCGFSLFARLFRG